MPRSISVREAAAHALTIEERVEELESGLKEAKQNLRTHTLYITQIHNTLTAIRMNIELRFSEICNRFWNVETLVKQFFNALTSVGARSPLPEFAEVFAEAGL